MHSNPHCAPIRYLDLSIEALWLARVLQDGMDVQLAKHGTAASTQAQGLALLRINRDIFERLGLYGCSACRVNPHSSSWSAAARLELMRQMDVHWRAFQEAASGTPWGAELLQSLTAHERNTLAQIQQLAHTLGAHAAPVQVCLQQQMDSMARQQAMRKAQLCLAYRSAIRYS